MAVQEYFHYTSQPRVGGNKDVMTQLKPNFYIAGDFHLMHTYANNIKLMVLCLLHASLTTLTQHR